MITRDCSVTSSTGQSHQAAGSGRALFSSSKRRRTTRAGFPTTTAYGSTSDARTLAAATTAPFRSADRLEDAAGRLIVPVVQDRRQQMDVAVCGTDSKKLPAANLQRSPWSRTVSGRSMTIPRMADSGSAATRCHRRHRRRAHHDATRRFQAARGYPAILAPSPRSKAARSSGCAASQSQNSLPCTRRNDGSPLASSAATPCSQAPPKKCAKHPSRLVQAPPTRPYCGRCPAQSPRRCPRSRASAGSGTARRRRHPAHARAPRGSADPPTGAGATRSSAARGRGASHQRTPQRVPDHLLSFMRQQHSLPPPLGGRFDARHVS